MSSDIENLTEKTENLSNDPIYDTNWCHMPDDIKLECIGKMDFNERMSLRCTAKAERSLVESKKIKFYECDIHRASDVLYDDGRNHYVSLTSKKWNSFSKTFENPNNAFKSMNYIWKIGVFNNLSIRSNDPAVKEELMNYSGKISAKHIELDCCDHEIVAAVLRKMNYDVESVTQVQNTGYWLTKDFKPTASLHNVAQILIDRDFNIGFTFQLSLNADGSFAEFLGHFVDRIVSKDEKTVRIRTNNPDRHILLQRGLDEVVKTTYRLQFFRLMVISAETKESEYDDDCKKWISQMDSEAYFDYDAFLNDFYYGVFQ